MCSHMEYVELHCHSAYSFLDGASQPEELVAAAVERGHTTLALTDHDSVSGVDGVRPGGPGAGAAGDPRGGGLARRRPASDAAGPRRHRVAQPLPPVDPCACPHARVRGGDARPHEDEPGGREAERRARDGARPRRGARLPERLCRPRRARRADDASPAGGLRPRAPAGRAPAPVRAPRPHAEPGLDRARQAARCALRGDRRRPRTQPRARAAAGRLRRDPRAHDARRLRAAAPWQPQPRARRAASDGCPLLRPPRGGCRDGQARRDADLRSRPATSATATPAPRTTGAAAELARVCAHAFATRYPSGHRLRDEAAARLDEELRVIGGLGLSGFFLLHRDLLELAREVAAEVRDGATARSLLPPGRGRGSSVSSIVCYLTGLSHVDPVANDLLLGRFLNEELTALPDIDLDFPRDIREVLIPRVHERYGRDRCGAGRGVPDLQGARGDPRDRQGARPAARGDRAGGSRLGGLVGAAVGRQGHRRRAGREPKDRPLGMAGRAVGAGVRPAAPSLPALRRDDRGDPAAGRLLPGGARRDGGPADGHVGQGLLRATRAF